MQSDVLDRPVSEGVWFVRSDPLALFIVSAAVAATFGLIYVNGKLMDKQNPEEFRHTRFTEAAAPYVIGLCLVGMATSGLILLLRTFAN
jgi:hypothetical protein